MYQPSPILLKYHLIFSLLLSIAFLPAHAQICSGNLGENIFEAGDFGSGVANNVATDPMIAPGFIYNVNPPPHDGDYILTNDMNQWNYVYPTWLKITDNSNDPNGYMMVVNASYSPGLFYEQEITGLCGNTLYVFSADIFNLIRTGTNLIKPNISFRINGLEAFTTGEIPEDQQWHTYGFTFTTDPGQGVITLSLRNNAPGGNGNDLALDNITFRPCGDEAQILPMEVANICEDGDPIALNATVIGDQFDTPAFQWQQSFDEGETWVDIVGENNPTYLHTALEGGYYYYRYLLANGMDHLLNSKCRVTSNIKIIHVIPKYYHIIDTLCEGLSYAIGDKEYTTTGMYIDSFTSTFGCDSIVDLDLTMLPNPGITADIDIAEPFCADSKDGVITIHEIHNATLPYDISIDDVLFPLNDMFTGLQAGDHLLQISDYYGCQMEMTVHIPAPPPFIIDLGPDITVELGDPINLIVTSSEAINNFHWIPISLNHCTDDCLQPQWTPTSTTTVSLSGSTENGCLAADSMVVHVINNRKIYIPNIFSPNNDGINDYFTILGAIPNIQQIKRLQIFDRWGTLVFERNNFQPNNLSIGWDGTYNGRRLAPGVFTYSAEIQFLDNRVMPYSGTVTLIR